MEVEEGRAAVRRVGVENHSLNGYCFTDVITCGRPRHYRGRWRKPSRSLSETVRCYYNRTEEQYKQQCRNYRNEIPINQFRRPI